MRTALAAILLGAVLCGCCASAQTKSAAVAPVGVAAVTAYGAANWDYGTQPFQFKREGWFGSGTESGGADKAGHLMAASTLTSGAAWLNRRWGYSRAAAARRGALTSFAIMGGMELGDGTSDRHGFSWEDIAINGVGATFGYFNELYPGFGEAVDIRWEYWPREEVSLDDDDDPFTGYENSTYLLCVNSGAVLGKQHTPLHFVDFQLGYQVRDLDKDEFRRQVVVGAGLNVANVLRRVGLGKFAHIFKHYQVPFVSLRAEIDLD